MAPPSPAQAERRGSSVMVYAAVAFAAALYLRDAGLHVGASDAESVSAAAASAAPATAAAPAATTVSLAGGAEEDPEFPYFEPAAFSGDEDGKAASRTPTLHFSVCSS
jgi:hypothetical protein